VHTYADPAVLIVNALMTKYTHVEAQLFCSDTLPQDMLSVNPKINNMLAAYIHAKYELVLVSDAGILSEFAMVT
jgi:ceramide glucosyltransferase